MQPFGTSIDVKANCFLNELEHRRMCLLQQIRQTNSYIKKEKKKKKRKEKRLGKLIRKHSKKKKKKNKKERILTVYFITVKLSY